jgi:hypothetical protein
MRPAREGVSGRRAKRGKRRKRTLRLQPPTDHLKSSVRRERRNENSKIPRSEVRYSRILLQPVAEDDLGEPEGESLRDEDDEGNDPGSDSVGRGHLGVVGGVGGRAEGVESGAEALDDAMKGEKVSWKGKVKTGEMGKKEEKKNVRKSQHVTRQVP